MSKFVHFQGVEGLDVYVNPAQVTGVIRAASPDWSTLIFPDGSRLAVKGLAEDIATALSLVSE